MDIFKIQRYVNSIDDTVIEKRLNIFTNEIKFVGIISLFDGVVYSEVGAVDLQSKDVHSAVNEWRLQHKEVLLKLAPSIAAIRKNQLKKEKRPWYKKLFFVK